MELRKEKKIGYYAIYFGRFRHFKQLNVEYAKGLDFIRNVEKGTMYADKAIFTDYRLLQKDENADLAKNISYIQYQYLYARSYFISEYKVNKLNKKPITTILIKQNSIKRD